MSSIKSDIRGHARLRCVASGTVWTTVLRKQRPFSLRESFASCQVTFTRRLETLDSLAPENKLQMLVNQLIHSIAPPHI